MEDGYRYVAIRGRAELDYDRERSQAGIKALAVRYEGVEDAERMVRNTFSKQDRVNIHISIESLDAHGIPDPISARVVALAGGVGGAKLASGLQAALHPGALAVVVNTADDFRLWGLRISPDRHGHVHPGDSGGRGPTLDRGRRRTPAGSKPRNMPAGPTSAGWEA